MPKLGTIYLLHFDKPYRHASHYLGWAKDLEKRLGQHASGSGARLMAVLKEHGIGWTLARTWDDVDRNYERRLKIQGGHSRKCPICWKNRQISLEDPKP